jgi:hypothetical protein
MEKSNYTKIEFLSPSEIKVELLSVATSKNKFGENHQSHKIKIKHVC